MCFWLHFLPIILIRHPSREAADEPHRRRRHTHHMKMEFEFSSQLSQHSTQKYKFHFNHFGQSALTTIAVYNKMLVFVCVGACVSCFATKHCVSTGESHFLHSKTILLKFPSGSNLRRSALCAPNRTSRRTCGNPQKQTASIKIYYLFVSVCLSLIIIVILIVLHHFIVRVFTLRHAANVPTVYSSGYNVHIFVNVFYWRRRILIHNFHLLLPPTVRSAVTAAAAAAALMCAASPDERTFRASI